MKRIVLLLALVLFFQIPYTKSKCIETASNFTSGSIFETNLDNLLYTFKVQSSSLKFYSDTAGKAPNKVYGLYLCRNDIDIDVCNTCIDGAYRGITGECPFSGEAIVIYDKCLLRYASRNIFNLSETSPALREIYSLEMPNYAVFVPIFNRTARELIKNASSELPYFATAKYKWASNQTVYSYAQCTPDLNVTECSSCLDTALTDMMKCCSKYMGAKILQPSCQIRFESAPFLNDKLSSLPASPPPLPPTHSPASRDLSFPSSTKTSLKPAIIGAIAASVSVGLIVVTVVLWICVCRKRNVPPLSHLGQNHGVEGLGEAELVQYDFSTMKTATGHFSAENTLGKGGFGYVYKGTLKNGDQLAIKRLSSTSGQGTEEFLAEARFLAKLQHNNVVKLVRFCLAGEEKLLVYDFMSNSSLEGFLFDPIKQPLLDWKTRSRIITGIAKGLQYLHEDSRLTIIHRDIKPENILLDNEMNPKIADFGLAKLTGVEEKYGITGIIKGTQGYMAPESVNGEFSNKSDIYSFGVMLLEIVSGQHNRKYYQANKKTLQSCACNLWNEGRPFDFRDPTLGDDCSRKDVIRCIQIGLLCLQTEPEKRPEISLIVSQLTSSGNLPSPSELGISSHQLIVPINDDGDQSTGSDTSSLTMQLTMTQDLYSKPR
ncbi:cysteine-rich receptor-like protein kinase 15 [Silene latifolia]|uniref:cysteine-rich receptor-like protein kinase 15 n=1 Tax=Silene latifolia TaxID=37657 RepID=UPI003D786C3B